MRAYEITPNGFCSGVKRAIEIVNDVINNEKTVKPIYMMGYIVHNKNIVKYFSKYINIITKDYEKEIDKIDKGTIIFTSHGALYNLVDKCLEKGLSIVDTTCPKVRRIQDTITNRVNDGYHVLVIGQDSHPEVKSYLSISKNVHMYNADNLLKFKNNDLFIVNQTTLIYEDVLETIKDINFENVEVSEEVCKATKDRQNALINSLDKFDLFIIVGDKLSNNCNSLYELALKNNKKAIKIENVFELNDYDLSDYKTIGVTAGASTPRSIINEVLEQINNNSIPFTSNLSDNDYIKF